MLLRCAFVSVQILVLLFMSSFIGSSGECIEEDKIAEQIVTIRGHVQTLNPVTQKVSIPVGQALVFQRADCKKCLLVTTTDENGNYNIRIGKGKYKLLTDVGYKVGKSDLAPGQPDYVNAADILKENIFNIRLVRKPHPLDVTISSN